MADGRASSDSERFFNARADGPRATPSERIRRRDYARRATGVALRLIERLMQSRIRVDGIEHLPPGPILFVANHFTRFETFILPYVIDKSTSRQAHTLAHHSLFCGRFGDYLRAVGALSTKDDGIKHTIVEDLLTGRFDWVIYPEGSMVKDKKTWSNGRFALNCPDRQGPPHTGAAVLALQVELARQRLRRAVATGDRDTVAALADRFHLHGPEDLAREDLSVVPVNLTYYPLRPSVNLAWRIAKYLIKKMPERLDEELTIEGQLLLGDTDIDIHFGAPIRFERYRELFDRSWRGLGRPDVEGNRRSDDEKEHALINALKLRVTNRFMGAIYRSVTVNIDHLFAVGLRLLSRDHVPCEQFHLGLFLVVRELQKGGRVRLHPSLVGGLTELAAGSQLPALADVRAMAERDGVLTVADGQYQINRAALGNAHDFNDIRVKNTLAVIANEIEPVREVMRALRHIVNLPAAALRARVAETLRVDDANRYEHDYAAASGLPERCAPGLGRPQFFPGGNEIGIVLMHGYMSVPEEVRPLAERLHADGHTVYCPRLAGHGTAPEQMATVTWREWLASVEHGVAQLRNRCRQVLVGGFSTGGLLALLAASRLTDVVGVFAINAPARLADPLSHLVPAVHGWNRLLDAFGIHRVGHLEQVGNDPEFPELNYHQHAVAALRQLELLIDQARSDLVTVTVPALIIQGDRDPVVAPDSGALIHAALGSEERELALMAFARHGILRGDGSAVVLERVAEFIAHRAARVRRSPSVRLVV